MAERNVEIRLTSTGFDDLKAKLDEIIGKLDELGVKLDEIDAKLDELGDKDATPRVELEGADETIAKMGEIDALADALGDKNIDIHTRVTGGGVDEAGKILAKDTEADVENDVVRDVEGSGGGGGIFGFLNRALFSGGGGERAAENAAGDAAGGGAGASGSVGPALLGTGIGLAALMAPALLPLLGGLGFVGLTGALGAATGGGGGMDKAMKNLESAIKPDPMALRGISSLMNELASGINKLQPLLDGLFKASMPAAKAFLGMMLQGAKIVLPAFTQIMKELTPSLPILMQGFLMLAKGIAAFTVALGPGIKPAAIIFKATMDVIGALLDVFGHLLSGLALLVVDFVEGWHRNFDQMVTDAEHWYHDVAGFIDRMEADFASGFNRIAETVIRVWDSIVNFFKTLPGEMLTIGRNIIEGLIHGIEDMAGSLLHEAEHIASSILHTFTGIFHIGSPSRVTYQHGLWLGEGLALGMQASIGRVNAAAADLGHAAMGGINGATAAGGSSAGSHVALEFTSHGSGIEDQLFRMLSKQIRVKGGNPEILLRKA